MFGSIKSLKMMGLASTVEGNIQEQRVKEIDLAKRFRWMMVLLNMIDKLNDFVKRAFS